MADQQPDPTAPEATPDEPTQDAPEVTPDPTLATPSTSSDSSEAPTGETPVAPVVVDNRTARDDNDGRLGHWVDVIEGKYKGRVGAYYSTTESDPKTGYPLRILVKTRDEFFQLIDVAYEHVRPSRFTGGR